LKGEKAEESITTLVQSPAPPKEIPAVGHVMHERPAPASFEEKPAVAPAGGFLSRIFGRLLKPVEEKPAAKAPEPRTQSQNPNRRGQQSKGQGSGRARNRGGDRGQNPQGKQPGNENNPPQKGQQQKAQPQQKGQQQQQKAQLQQKGQQQQKGPQQ